MIVCVCRNINDKAVRAAVDSGARRPKDVQAFHGCTFDCGSCKPMISAIIKEETKRPHHQTPRPRVPQHLVLAAQ